MCHKSVTHISMVSLQGLQWQLSKGTSGNTKYYETGGIPKGLDPRPRGYSRTGVLISLDHH